MTDVPSPDVPSPDPPTPDLPTPEVPSPEVPAPPVRRARSRLPALAAVGVLVGGVVLAGLTLDRRDPQAAPTDPVAPGDLAPVAPGPDSGGSTWFCAGGTGAAGGAVHRVHVANPGESPVDVLLTVVPGAARGEEVTARAATESIEVAPGTSETVVLAEVVDAPFLAAVVEAGPGQVAVEHSVSATTEGDVGDSPVPCASTSATTSYLAAGVTTRDASEQLLLFNPFPDDAVVDVTFATPDGLRAPPAFDGLIIPGRRVLAVDVGEVVSRHPNVATSIVARTGRFVADRIQRFDGSSGPAGLALTGAAPSAAFVWHFPDGQVAEGVEEIVTVYNPTERQAEVDVELALDPSDDVAQPVAVEPFQLSIAPLQYVQVPVGSDGRVALGRGHSLTVRSQNGVGVVAERWLRVSEDAGGPGLVATLGSPLVATRWLAATGAVEGGTEQLVLANPSLAEVARVVVSAASPDGAGALADLREIEIAPAGRVVIDLSEQLTDAPLVLIVQASLPIVAERIVVAAPDTAAADGLVGRGQSILLAVVTTASVPDVEPGEVPTGPLPTVRTTTSSSSTSSTSSTSTSTSSTSTSTTTTAPTAGTTTTAPP